MLIELFVILLVTSLALVIIGYAVDLRILAVVGFFFIFLLSFTLINNDLEYETGASLSFSGNSTTVTYTYNSFSNNTFQYGLYMAVVGALGMAGTFMIGKQWNIGGVK